MENYNNGQPAPHPPLPTPVQVCPQFSGLQIPNYFQGQNTQTGNMYISANNNMNQQIGQVPNIIAQPFFMPAVTTSAQQPFQQTTLQVNYHKANMTMDDYELSDNGSVNDDPGNLTNDWQCVQNNKKRKIAKTQPTKSTNFHSSQQNRFESLANSDVNTKESTDVQQRVNPKPPPVFVHGVTDYKK